MVNLPFTLVSPEKVLFDQDVSMAVIPGVEGDIGILPNHSALLTLLRPGVVTLYKNEKNFVRVFIDGGFSQITPEGCVTLVTEGLFLEALDKASLELEIKNLIEDVIDSRTVEERTKADKNLEVARAKLMAVVIHHQT